MEACCMLTALQMYRTFPPQLALATKHDLPLFLHPRNCHDDFIALLRACPSPLRGVFHSVIASLEEALEPDRPRSVDRNQRVALPKLSKTSLSSNDFHSNRSWSNLIVLGARFDLLTLPQNISRVYQRNCKRFIGPRW